MALRQDPRGEFVGHGGHGGGGRRGRRRRGGALRAALRRKPTRHVQTCGHQQRINRWTDGEPLSIMNTASQLAPPPHTRTEGTWACVPVCGSDFTTKAEWPRAKPPAGGPFQNTQTQSFSVLVTKILKALAASAGPAVSRTGLIFLVTSPEDNYYNYRGGSAILPQAGGLA